MRRIILAAFTLLFVTATHAGEPVDAQLAEAEKALKQAAKRLAELHAQGHAHAGAKRAMLGVLLDDGPMVGGVPISGTTPKGGAAQAGLEAGDKIIVIDGIELSDLSDPLGALSSHMKSVAPGDVVELTYMRGSKQIHASVTTRARSAHVISMIDGLGDKFDFDFDFDMKNVKKYAIGNQPLLWVKDDLAEYFDVTEGVIVTAVKDGSGLKGGDVLLAIDNTEVESVGHVIELLSDLDHPVKTKIKRQGRTRTIDLNPHEFHGLSHVSQKKEVKVIKIIEDD